ncbi:MAG: RMD1 family protein [Bdellovibrio sp.]|nr:RMD1 family protein [Bdellovibrio sp.]
MGEVVQDNECIAYGVGGRFEIPNLLEDLSRTHPVTRYRDVYHLTFKDVVTYIFDYGVIVFWGGDRRIHEDLLDRIKHHIHRAHVDYFKDTFTYSKGEGLKIQNDHITLPGTEELETLALSHAIAQSTKLSQFEDSAASTVESSRHIPKALAQDGKIQMTKKAISKMRGRLYLVKSDINLQHGLLDTPEFFWEYPELEPIYTAMNRYLDIYPRIEVLNRKLEVIHELFSMLADEQNYKYSNYLEWIIILLISVEIIFTIIHDVLKLF